MSEHANKYSQKRLLDVITQGPTLKSGAHFGLSDLFHCLLSCDSVKHSCRRELIHNVEGHWVIVFIALEHIYVFAIYFQVVLASGQLLLELLYLRVLSFPIFYNLRLSVQSIWVCLHLRPNFLRITFCCAYSPLFLVFYRLLNSLSFLRFLLLSHLIQLIYLDPISLLR